MQQILTNQSTRFLGLLGMADLRLEDPNNNVFRRPAFRRNLNAA
jgi:hypothetical protein